MLFHSSNVNQFHRHFVLENQCFERIPIFYQNKLQFVDQGTRKILPWSIKALNKTDKFDQQISPDGDGDESNCLTPYPIKAQNHLKAFTPDKVESRFTHAEFMRNNLA